MSMMTENYCSECDKIVHAVFCEDDFYGHRVGTVKCPSCGAIIEPCNECENRLACDYCPWRNVPAVDAMPILKNVELKN